MKHIHRVLWAVTFVLTAWMTIATCRQTFGQIPREPESIPRTRDAERGRRGDQGRRREGRDGMRGGGPRQRYSIDQTVSDNAQLHTIAFSGLAFLTGDFGASTFIPPGKVCDYFGFQYMRDIDAAGKGHNPMFLNRVAGNVLQVLSEKQKQVFRDLAAEQAPQLESLARMRLPLIKAFHQQRDGVLPAGSTGLNKQAVAEYVGEIFARDAELSLRRAEAMAQVYRSLTDDQRSYFAKMKFGDFDSWPPLDQRDRPQERSRGRSKLHNVAYMTYVSEFFSWTAGSVEADAYFCPERHGTYFGGFYMKDMPAMGKRDFDISTSVTGDSGRDFLEAVLSPEQRRVIVATLDPQRQALEEIVTLRKSISTELRKLLVGTVPDRDKVVALGRRYGQLDGEMSWRYTMAFSEVNRTLTDDQRAALKRLRNLEGYQSAPYYLFSQAVQASPELESVDRFFAEPSQTEAGTTETPK